MSEHKKEIKEEYKCMACGNTFDKYSVIHFSKFDICDGCFKSYPASREKGILINDDALLAYFKDKNKK